MIEFNGELSNECKKSVRRKGIKVIVFACVIFILVFCIPTIIVAIVLKTWFIPIAIIIVIVIAGIGLALGFSFEIVKILRLNGLIKIDIEQGTITFSNKQDYINKHILQVKKVVDKGNWYDICFYFGYKSGTITCQKNLITKGTIEEFEKLFEGKIVRKFKTTKKAE